ncbi:MAG TPA: methylthioribulose 1-phosphate dehydratase [Caulobacteraceae bacterium]|nr:methylthioribulose 1-phosphate dehydratase [Caulobacteraceae bacterium]
MNQEVEQIVEAARFLGARGWAPAGAGNYSHRLADGTIAVTVSGAQKAQLTPADVMRVDAEGRSLDGRQPSAEAALHLAVYRLDRRIRAVLHTHSIPAVVLSRVLPKSRLLTFKGYELQKAFPGVKTHEATVGMPIFDNSQDMHALANRVSSELTARRAPAFLIRNHGLYGWGASVDEAMRVVEAAETLIACELEVLRFNHRP